MADSIINKWSVLQKLSKDFVSNINSVYIYGTNGKQVIVITNDDNVYSFGDNDRYGCLGLGHTNAIQEPTVIEELCAKQVKQIEFGYSYKFVLALTQNGDVFSWGTNGSGELGIGNIASQLKPIIIEVLIDKNAIDIKSGLHHSFALTLCGDVYISGKPMDSIPMKMTFESMNQKIVAISSGGSHALALTNTGNVLYWGNNSLGECGNGNNNHSIDAKWSETRNTTDLHITKIACGISHSMILSTKGIVYCFGYNYFGQCGDGTNIDKNIPTKVNINVNFIDIFATKHNHMSVGLTANGCYIWGSCGQNSLISPMEIPFNNINQVLQHYSTNKVTLMPLRFTDNEYKVSSLIERISEKFNKREYSDITFKVGDQSNYAQKTHLINVCKHFEAMFLDNNWIESNTSEIEIKDYSYAVYYAFIKYLYTESIDLSSDDNVMELMDLANCYLDETLKQRCVQLIKNSIKNENVFAIFFSAVKYDSNELKAYCLEFLKNNFVGDSNIKAIMENAVKFTDN